MVSLFNLRVMMLIYSEKISIHSRPIALFQVCCSKKKKFSHSGDKNNHSV